MNREGAETIADEIGGAAYELDVRSEESIAAAVAGTQKDLGPVDVLVNNAGYDEWSWFTDTDPALWDRVLVVNLRGVIAVTHAVLPGMQERRRGRIVNTASEAGRVGSSGSAVYSAAKAGVIGFTKALAIENGRYGITCNAVAPGPIDTPLLMGAPDQLGDLGKRIVETMVGSTNLRRLGQPDEVAAAISFLASDDASVTVLIPNERGLDNALEVRDAFDEVNLFLSASETHNRKNVNRSIEESLSGLERVVATALEHDLRCEGVISVSFGCPYEGEVPPDRVFGIAERLAAAGCAEIAFGDTTGMANPRQVGEFFAAARETLGDVELTAHFHNTRGQGLANVLAALEQGVDSFESSFGELGGCPVPPGATGNISTEDLVSMLHEMGVETGIDLGRLLEAARAAQDVLGRPLGSHVLTAGPVVWN